MRYLASAVVGTSCYYLLVTGLDARRLRLRAIGLTLSPISARAKQSWLSPKWVCWLVGLAIVLIIPSPVSIIGCVVVATVGPGLLSRLESRSDREFRQRCEGDVSLALDLAATCLMAGVAIEAAVTEVSRAIGGPLAQRLDEVLKQLRLGADPVIAWRTLGPGEELQRLGDALARSTRAGSVSAPLLHTMAREARQRLRLEGQARARQVAVRTAGPLGLCFLPAFVLLAVVPVVYGAVVPLVS